MLRIVSLALVGLTLALLLFWPASGPERRILFIGNSFTYGGNVPEQVRRIAATADRPARYTVAMHARGGTSLHEHLLETDPMASIADGPWDVVVLQDASWMPFSAPRRAEMAEAVAILAAAAQEQGADVVFFAHWPPADQAHDPFGATAHIEQTYDRLATETGGHVARVGRYWLAARQAGFDGLYDPLDGHHSSLAGAYVAALALTQALGDVDVATSTWVPDGVAIDPAAVAAALEDLPPTAP